MCPAVDEVEQHNADPDEDQSLKAADAGADAGQRDAHAEGHDREDELSPVGSYVRMGGGHWSWGRRRVRRHALPRLGRRCVRRWLRPQLVIRRLALR